MRRSLIATLATAARTAAHRTASRHPCGACAAADREPGDPGTEVLADRPDGTVVRHGPVVAKAHAPDTDRAALDVRLAVAAHPFLHGVLLAPLQGTRASVPTDPVPPRGAGNRAPGPHRPVDEHAALPSRSLTLWPHGTPVDPTDPDSAPWAEAGRLLAALHRVPIDALPGPLPAMRGPVKAARAVARMRNADVRGSTADAVLRAWSQLPAWARAETPYPGPATAPHPRPAEGPHPGPAASTARLCHGDLHLGQLVRDARTGDWLLIDVDDLGLGEPAWDLARPAAWYAAGLLDPDDWARFLAAYREAGGPAVPPEGDPWPQLDVPARALTVQTAALALAKCADERRAPDEAELAMIGSCTRIAALPPEFP
ncbi:aminoglycoside phosphotransferase family protein [Streptomyces sp. TLI_146]|uniref:aminoglycoside phosphotransferase family protein n=1 Tax=Streptomyces sp. TLI_146 TaxID=1938858 RepID=UPI000C714072|nr:aminoglycoside phosphotransferase family protein [Streptomyces sp. TLI_146]PKV84697.1 phosphotransferase family enzyme [Streptomyces sp. TLI_146]